MKQNIRYTLIICLIVLLCCNTLITSFLLLYRSLLGISLIEHKDQTSNKVSLCPHRSANLLGQVRDAGFPNKDLAVFNISNAELIDIFPDAEPGGHFRPVLCQANSRVAIIIPFRDRLDHLNYFLYVIIPFLQRQQLDFQFIVVEQNDRNLFNKGKLYNAGFEVARTLNVDCVIFHDVDMIPLDDRNYYGCPNQPRHLAPYTDTLQYKLWYKNLVGGVFAVKLAHFEKLNGYSEEYWGWGGEDDDIGFRITGRFLKIERPSLAVGRYTMINHAKKQGTAKRFVASLLMTAHLRWDRDGLSSRSTRTIQKIVVEKLYRHVFVDVGTPPPHAL